MTNFALKLEVADKYASSALLLKEAKAISHRLGVAVTFEVVYEWDVTRYKVYPDGKYDEIELMGNLELNTVKTYHPNGNRAMEYTINEQGQKHGTYKVWYENGQIRVQREFVNGEIHGTYQFWRENGKLFEQSEWVNGNYHGIRYVWKEEGSIRYIELYDNDNKLIKINMVDENGNKLKKPILTILKPNHANIGVGLIQCIKLLQEKGIKFKIAKIGDSSD